MSNIKVYEYLGFPIQFEVINGQVMVNATSMAKPFNKKPDDILRTFQWREYEEALIEVKSFKFEDLRISQMGSP